MLPNNKKLNERNVYPVCSVDLNKVVKEGNLSHFLIQEKRVNSFSWIPR